MFSILIETSAAGKRQMRVWSSGAVLHQEDERSAQAVQFLSHRRMSVGHGLRSEERLHSGRTWPRHLSVHLVRASSHCHDRPGSPGSCIVSIPRAWILKTSFLIIYSLQSPNIECSQQCTTTVNNTYLLFIYLLFITAVIKTTEILRHRNYSLHGCKILVGDHKV